MNLYWIKTNFSKLLKKENLSNLSISLKKQRIFFTWFMALALFFIPAFIYLYVYAGNNLPFIFNLEMFLYFCPILCIIMLLIFNSRGYFNLAVFLFLIIYPLFIYIPAALHRNGNLYGELFLYILIPLIFSCVLGKFRITLFYTLFNLGYILGSLFIFLPKSFSISHVRLGFFMTFACFIITGIARVKFLIEKGQAEQAKKTENNFNILFNSSTFGIAFADPATKKFVTVNNAFCEMLGCTEKQALQKSVYDIHPPESLPFILNEFDSLLSGVKNNVKKIPVLKSDHTIFFADIISIVMELENRRYAVGFFQDNTSQYLAEETLRLEMEKTQQYLNVAAVMIVAINRNGTVVLINRKGCEVLEYNEEEITGTNWFDVYLPEYIRENVKQIFYRLINGTGGSDEYFENPVITKTGKERMIAWHNTLLLDKDGRPYCSLSSGEDITDRRKAEVEREYLIKEMEAKNTRLEQFSYTASHDLKTPLITIKGFLNVLSEDLAAGNSEEIKKDFTFICNAVDKMWNLLNDLLQYSRLGRFEVFEDIPFSGIAGEALLLVSGNLKSKNVNVEIADKLPTVKGDKTRLVQLLQNLLDNAIKFTGNQQQALIKIGCKQIDKQEIFFVQDNGIGIEPEYHEKVFQLFNQLNPAINGTGIGLTLARRIIEIHGGQIWVESEGKNKGTTINFTLRRNQ